MPGRAPRGPRIRLLNREAHPTRDAGAARHRSYRRPRGEPQSPVLRRNASVSWPAGAACALWRDTPCGRGRATPNQWVCQRQAQPIHHRRHSRRKRANSRPTNDRCRRPPLAHLPKPRHGETKVAMPKPGSRKPKTRAAAAAASIRRVTATGRSTGWLRIFEFQGLPRHHYARADAHPAVQIHNVLVVHADAAVGDEAADRARRIGAVDGVFTAAGERHRRGAHWIMR